MINAQVVEAAIRTHYPNLEKVGEGIFRAVDRHADREYAVRYFDLNDAVLSMPGKLKSYQDDVISENYFNGKGSSDLRWNHYLYFVTSKDVASAGGFKKAKALIEADREFARKRVLLELDVNRILSARTKESTLRSMPVDLATTWMKRLDSEGLGFVLGTDSVPKVVARIVDGHKEKAGKIISPIEPTPAESAAARCFLKNISIQGFRRHPETKEHVLGKVNLIVGSNGVGKTSLLEAIEYLYCGRNARNTGVLPSTKISAEMIGSGEKLLTTSSTEAQHLRARHSSWYAKSEERKMTIANSFGKFNFLDTDAAVELTLETSVERIGDDVAKLLLGAEAEKLKDRMERVLEQLASHLKDLQKDVSQAKVRKLEASARLEVLRKAPQVSDSLFAELLIALDQIKWVRRPQDKFRVDSIRADLQLSLNSADGLIRSQAIQVSKEFGGAINMRNVLVTSLETANTLARAEKSKALEVADLNRLIDAASRRLAALSELAPFVASNFSEIVAQHAALETAVGNLRARLAGISGLNHAAISSSSGTLPLMVAITSLEAKVSEHRERLSQSQITLSTFEKTQSELAVLNQRLVSMAQDLIAKTQDSDHCPLCQTEFAHGELMDRIASRSINLSEATLAELQKNIRGSEAELAATEKELACLSLLRGYFISNDLNLTVSDAKNRLDREVSELHSQEISLISFKGQLTKLASTGVSAEKLSDLLTFLGLDSLPSEEELASAKSDASSDVAKNLSTKHTVEDSIRTLRQEVEVVASRFSIPISSSIENVSQELRAKLASCDAAVESLRALKATMGRAPDSMDEQLLVGLEAVQALVIMLVTAISQEKESDAAVAQETVTIERFSRLIESGTGKANNVKKAESVLEGIVRESSGDDLTARILFENAEEIGRTFSGIHSPNEFDIAGEGGNFRIIRRDTKKAVTLSEMSTGQRAAFALSLFLAMNYRLESGPPVLLFDDPIAHVDDINVLSFLDHLRDLALKGSRQIFFATADTKLASLFRHKFRFMGDEDFREISLARLS